MQGDTSNHGHANSKNSSRSGSRLETGPFGSSVPDSHFGSPIISD